MNNAFEQHGASIPIMPNKYVDLLPFPDQMESLLQELSFRGYSTTEIKKIGPFIRIPQKEHINFFFPKCAFLESETLKFKSVKHAVDLLKERHLRWAYSPNVNHRKAQLILDGIKEIKTNSRKFPLTERMDKKFGHFTLLDEDTLWCSRESFPEGPFCDFSFEEDKVTPPNRAYLKLWEALTRLQIHMGNLPKNSRSLDLGSSPGGWTWVLSETFSQVFSIDRSTLDPKIQNRKNVSFETGNVFTLSPTHYGSLDLICSDVICEPKKLYEMAMKWLSEHPQATFIWTLKFKGEVDFETATRFSNIERSRVLHLQHNKNELTWVRYGK